MMDGARTTRMRRGALPVAGGLLLALAALSSTGCVHFSSGPPSREEVLQDLLPSAVQVVVEQREGRRVRTGSGVVVAAGHGAQAGACYVITSGHAVPDAPGTVQTYVLLNRHLGRGTKVRAEVLAQRDTERVDLALLRAETDRCAPAPLGSGVFLGESVWVVGFPWGQSMNLFSGVVSQIELEGGEEGETARLMIDAPVTYGASGGGVYAARTGRLIGIVEGYRTARISSQGTAPSWFIDVPVPGQTFVTPVGDIRTFLTETGYAGVLGSAAASAQLPAGR